MRGGWSLPSRERSRKEKGLSDQAANVTQEAPAFSWANKEKVAMHFGKTAEAWRRRRGTGMSNGRSKGGPSCLPALRRLFEGPNPGAAGWRTAKATYKLRSEL